MRSRLCLRRLSLLKPLLLRRLGLLMLCLLLLNKRSLLHLLVCQLRVLLFPEVGMLQCLLCRESACWFEMKEAFEEVDCEWGSAREEGLEVLFWVFRELTELDFGLWRRCGQR
jgi:hypothetical protein